MRKLIVAMMVFAMMLSAAVVSVDRAQTVAENYYQNYAPATSKANVVKQVLTKEYMGQPTWYVVEFTKGFVIVAADDNVRPILGYSFNGTIDEDIYNMNNPFVAKFSTFDKQIVHVIREENMVVASKQKEWKDIENKVFHSTKAIETKGPLLETTWGQGYPFDDQVPAGAPVGCVATAIHQILRFYQGPSDGAGSNSYTDFSGDITGSHDVTFSNFTYDWPLQATLNGSVSSQAEIDECSKMAYHIGVSVNMDYNTSASGGSGATMTAAAAALRDHWASPTASLQYIGTVTDSSAYYLTLKAEIDADRPVNMAGTDLDYGGHAYVLDGYNIGTLENVYQYHFNWGWSGSYDGWYQLNDLTPGVNDFTSQQDMITGIYVDGLLAQMPEPENLGGSVDAEGNATLTWDAPGTVNPMGDLYDYYIFREGEYVGNVGGTTRSYTDPVLPEGSFDYVVKAVYYYDGTTNPMGNSLPSNTYSVSVTPDPNHPVPIGVTATSYQNNRSYIDLAWAKPWIGEGMQDGFEVGNTHYEQPVGWTQRGSDVLDQAGMTWGTPVGVAPDQGLIVYNSATYANQGEWAMLANDSNDGTDPMQAYNFLYAFTDAFTLAPGATFSFYYLAPIDGGIVHIVTYNGDFTEPDPSVFLDVAQTFNLTEGDYDVHGKQEVDLSAYTGTYRVGFCKEVTNLAYSFFDDLAVGVDLYPAGDQPTSYEIWNNGSLEATVSVTGLEETYQSTDFTDGWNEYYIRAKYADNQYSIASNKKSAWIDANPVPVVLYGAWDDVNTEVDLDWYAPGHYPPHWFGYQWENDAWNYLTLFTGASNDVTKARTYYTAEDFGMSYPVYISDLSAAFYDDTADGGDGWTSSTYTITLGTGTEGAENYIETSGNLTALGDGTWVDYALSQTYTLNEDWFVEVTFGSAADCTPSIMTFAHEEGVDDDQWNSVWYYAGDGTNQAGWYAFSYDPPYEFEDFAFLCYGWNDAPTITKDGVASIEPQPFTSIKNKKDLVKNTTSLNAISVQPQDHDGARKLSTDESKGLDNYKIYRNGSLYDTAAGTTYSDTAPTGSNEYYVTAVYSSPVGESDSTNHVKIGPPPAIALPSPIAEQVAPSSTDTGSWNLTNNGLGDLDYGITFEYDGFAAAGGTYHSNDFTTYPGTGYTTTGTDWRDGGGTAYALSDRDIETSTLLSPQFDTSSGVDLTLEFTHTFNANSGSGQAVVEYYNGSAWVELVNTTADLATTTESFPIDGSTTTQIRFTFTGTKSGGSTDNWTIDDILVTSGNVPYTWNTITSATSGTVSPSSVNAINYSIDTAGLTDGNTYTGRYIVTSNDAGSPDTLEVSLLVQGGGPVIPGIPVNLTTTVSGTDLIIDWDDSADATGYDVYSSADPYGTFTLETSVTPSTYTVAHGTKMFYYIIATNATKQGSSPKTIYIAKPSSR